MAIHKTRRQQQFFLKKNSTYWPATFPHWPSSPLIEYPRSLSLYSNVNVASCINKGYLVALPALLSEWDRGIGGEQQTGGLN